MNQWSPEQKAWIESYSFVFRSPQFAREVASAQAPQQQRPQPPAGLNVHMAGRLMRTQTETSNASNIAGTLRTPHTLKKTVGLKGATWRPYTQLKNRTSSCKRSTHHMKSGSEQWTIMTGTGGGGLMGPLLISPTGSLVSLMEDITTPPWPLLLGDGGIVVTMMTPINTFASLAFKILI